MIGFLASAFGWVVLVGTFAYLYNLDELSVPLRCLSVIPESEQTFLNQGSLGTAYIVLDECIKPHKP